MAQMMLSIIWISSDVFTGCSLFNELEGEEVAGIDDDDADASFSEIFNEDDDASFFEICNDEDDAPS